MQTYDFVQLTLLALGGEVRGKTLLQKLIYFLGVKTGCLDELGYRAHFYGPYSAEVADAVGRLRTLGFIDQRVFGAGAVDTRGFEVARYDYALNETGKDIAEKKSKKYPELWEKINKALEEIKSAGKMDYVKLSIAAKTYFMLGEKKGAASREDLSRMAKGFGWSVSEQQVTEAANYLEAVDLVEVVN